MIEEWVARGRVNEKEGWFKQGQWTEQVELRSGIGCYYKVFSLKHNKEKIVKQQQDKSEDWSQPQEGWAIDEVRKISEYLTTKWQDDETTRREKVEKRGEGLMRVKGGAQR